MRVCPKCGYVDPPEWRHSKFSYWIDFCLWDDFKKLMPELAKDLETHPNAVVEDKEYLYRVTKNKSRVHRKAKVDYGYQWSIPMEHHTLHPIHNVHDFRKYWQLTHPSQTRLLEVTK